MRNYSNSVHNTLVQRGFQSLQVSQVVDTWLQQIVDEVAVHLYDWMTLTGPIAIYACFYAGSPFIVTKPTDKDGIVHVFPHLGPMMNAQVSSEVREAVWLMMADEEVRRRKRNVLG